MKGSGGKSEGKVIKLASGELRPILQLGPSRRGGRWMEKQAIQERGVQLGPSIIRDRRLRVHREGQGKRPCPPGESWGLGSRLRRDWHCQIQVWLRLALVWGGEYGLGPGLGCQTSHP